jgi:hypothetical protein
LKSLKKCTFCLKEAHQQGENCPMTEKIKCHLCNGTHRAFLCPNPPKQKPHINTHVATEEVPPEEVRSLIETTYSPDEQTLIAKSLQSQKAKAQCPLLMTQIVTVKGRPETQGVNVCILMDTGAEKSMITEELAEKLAI